MVCPACTPVVTTDPLGNYLRTDCRECGMTMPRDGDEIDAAEFAEGPFTPQEVADLALEMGILEEPLDVSDFVGARIEDDKLILSFADDTMFALPVDETTIADDETPDAAQAE